MAGGEHLETKHPVGTGSGGRSGKDCGQRGGYEQARLCHCGVGVRLQDGQPGRGRDAAEPIAGLVRESIFAHYFGNSDAADAFKAAFRIPNILQNLFGEGVLSASFIPVYSRLLGAGEDEHANELAWTLGAIMSLSISLLVLLGVAAAPYMIDAIAPGFHGPKRELTILLVRIFFPAPDCW